MLNFRGSVADTALAVTQYDSVFDRQMAASYSVNMHSRDGVLVAGLSQRAWQNAAIFEKKNNLPLR